MINQYSSSEYCGLTNENIGVRKSVYLFSTVPTEYYEDLGPTRFYNFPSPSYYYKRRTTYFYDRNFNISTYCFRFDFSEPDNTSYGLVDLYYSSECFREHYSRYLPTTASSYDENNNFLFTYADNIEVMQNFELYNQTTGETSYSNVNSNIVVPPDNVVIDNRSWYQRLFDSIISIPGKILNGLVSVVSDIVNGIKSIFIPDQQMALDTLSSEYTYLHDRLGFLFYPVELITDFATRFYNISNNGNAVFTIPDVSFMNHTLIHSTSINLNDIVNSSPIIISIYNIYLVVVSALVVIWVSQLAYQKFNETIGGNFK